MGTRGVLLSLIKHPPCGLDALLQFTWGKKHPHIVIKCRACNVQVSFSSPTLSALKVQDGALERLDMSSLSRLGDTATEAYNSVKEAG